MHRLTLSEFIITIALLLLLAFSASRLLQQFLLNVAEGTGDRMQQASKTYNHK